MRLSSLIPLLPEHLVKALEICDIRTDTDLLFSGSPLDILHQLPPNTVNLPDLTKYIEQVIEKASAPAIRGDEWLARESQATSNLSSGVTELDDILKGFSSPCLLEFSGSKGSGKTALALHLVLRHLVNNPDAGALWIDTLADFSVERVSETLAKFDQETSSTVLERLQVSLVFDIEAVHDVLEELRSKLSSETPISTGVVVRYVVIDAITPLLAPLLSAVSSQGHAIMTTFMRQLSVLTETFSLVIIIINTTSASLPTNPHSAFPTTTKKPALGPSYTYLSDATLWLAKSNEIAEDGCPTHVIEVFRSRKSV
ncbi:hypothetical protein JAAARDRAFT_58515 [Jaapia argillacea MUCL 33604]|uniref:RecA family profile 1 domain-containing protein n=1 Tax=Jaapia argillacea MUCL 33604 TaxID=933084 RepID=A0A067PQD8_9AGAM|nr:hypothetical protein JAAARDRAFT_58515 [Jaapia argillacea MUCL 33604]